jgi:hypothetical protein
MTKRIFFIIILLLFGRTLSASDTLFFKVTLLGLHCASVEVIENQIDEDVTEIIYHAFTVKGFDTIYKIDNWYYYYTDPNMTHIDSLQKHIVDRNMDLYYREDIYDGTIHYPESHTLGVSEPVHHILSALVYLQHYPEQRTSNYDLPFLITDEGDLYQVDIKVEKNYEKMQDEVFFSFEHVAGEEILDPTDVFNWMICAGKGTRMLAYSHADNTITEGAFSLGFGGLHLRAQRVYK